MEHGAKMLKTFESEDTKAKFGEGVGIEYFDEEIIPITTNGFLCLSGTPFRAITSGEFIEEQIFNWTYSTNNELKMNGKWLKTLTSLRMVMLTYQMPDSIKHVAIGGEFNEFDLNVFLRLLV